MLAAANFLLRIGVRALASAHWRPITRLTERAPQNGLIGLMGPL
jgi:hypothetical protein